MKRQFSVLCLIWLASACSPSSDKDAPVLTADAAIGKAKVSWHLTYEKTRSATFSEENVARFEPYTAVLDGEAWRVRGMIPQDFHGVVPEATVQRKDGYTSVEGVQR
jgi:hypothetical protein